MLGVDVVATAASTNGMGGTNITHYIYFGLKAEVGTSRGMLSFRWTNAKSLDTGMVAKSETRL